jgi:phytanoyl-CoA hydroxylase
MGGAAERGAVGARERFRDQGFVVAPGVLGAEEIERYRQRAREVVLGDVPAEAKRRLMRDVRIAKGLVPEPSDPEDGMWKILNPDRFDATFREFLTTPRLLDVAETLLGPDLISFLLMFIYKPKGITSVHPFHQDAYYFPFGPDDDIAGVWVPLDDTDADNGGLTVVPGSHRGPVLDHAMPDELTNARAYGIPGADEREGAVSLEVAAGDAVFFHSRLWHKTGSNITQRHRRVLTMHLCSARCAMTHEATIDEFGMTLVRGETHKACLQPTAASRLDLNLSDEVTFRT